MPLCLLHLHLIQNILCWTVPPYKSTCSKSKRAWNAVLAITDRGNMYGAVDFIKPVKNGIKPIIGCEVYVATENKI